MVATMSQEASGPATTTSCPQTAEVQVVWIAAALLMTMLTITATTVAAVMGLLLYMKKKQEQSKNVKPISGSAW